MSYLDKVVFEMKQKIVAVCDNVRDATTEEMGEEMDRIEALIREKLTESFKNGIEVGRKEAAQGKQKPSRKR